MKKMIAPLIFSAMLLTGCQSVSKSLGGNTTIKLEPGQKLEEITWKDGSDLWYLTRLMRDDEEPETHVFHQSTDFGFEGSVTIIEQK